MKRMFTLCALATSVFLLASATHVNAAEERTPEKVLKHIVLFKFSDTATKEEVQGIVDAFVALEEKIDLIKAFEWGTNVSKENLDKGLTHGFTLTFHTQDDLDAYIVHPDHKTFVKGLDGKIADVCVFDYWAQ